MTFEERVDLEYFEMDVVKGSEEVDSEAKKPVLADCPVPKKEKIPNDGGTTRAS
jgi:hypothetical protein